MEDLLNIKAFTGAACSTAAPPHRFLLILMKKAIFAKIVEKGQPHDGNCVKSYGSILSFPPMGGTKYYTSDFTWTTDIDQISFHSN